MSKSTEFFMFSKTVTASDGFLQSRALPVASTDPSRDLHLIFIRNRKPILLSVFMRILRATCGLQHRQDFFARATAACSPSCAVKTRPRRSILIGTVIYGSRRRMKDSFALKSVSYACTQLPMGSLEASLWLFCPATTTPCGWVATAAGSPDLTGNALPLTKRPLV